MTPRAQQCGCVWRGRIVSGEGFRKDDCCEVWTQKLSQWRGSLYEYVSILRKHAMVSSMSRPANPYDNASCESFIKTLKREEIYANEYENLEHLRDHIEEFIDRYYNQKRLHSALGYRSPEEFEQEARLEDEATTIGATVTFFQGSPEEVSTEVVGEGTQMPSLPRTPSLLGESTR